MCIRDRAFRGGNVVLKIESKPGKLIQEVSLLPLDKEVLFRTGREFEVCLLYTSPSPRDRTRSRMPSSA